MKSALLLAALKATGLYACSAAPHLNVFATTTHAKNRPIKLDYRTSNGAGVCVHGFMPGAFDPVLLSLAVTPEHEEYSDGNSDDTVRAMLRLNFKAPLNAYSALGSDLVYTPDVAGF